MPGFAQREHRERQRRAEAAAAVAASRTQPTTPVTNVSPLLPRVNLKTSRTHPLNVSWLLPDELVVTLSVDPFPPSSDIFDIYSNPSLVEQYKIRGNELLETLFIQKKPLSSKEHIPVEIGNFGLSSCPGKKVRLNGPVRGRATIDRDLVLDFQRLRTMGVTTIVCCLNDEELRYLGAPWSEYNNLAQQLRLKIIRLPMVEGGCPDSLEQIDEVVVKVDHLITKGERVLAHCRGGVGRAGLVACCWLLKRQFCYTADHAIQMVRMRRSPKAIETPQQVDFIVQYENYINWKIKSELQEQQKDVDAAATLSSLPTNGAF
ncbi:hypothetical protein G9A89_017462 [Geosiphon pyriformis]|nr:hypothetical protein G9A89_017462 [Geosiphon pyriformis]